MDSTTGTYICPVCKEQVPVGMRCSRCNAGLPPSKTDYAALTEENKRLREALDRVRAALAAWEDAAPECVQDIRRALEEGSDG